MRSKFDEQLALLNRDLTKMGSLCEEALALAAKALANADGQTAAKIAPIDSEIDQMERTIESLCLKLLLQQYFLLYLNLHFQSYFAQLMSFDSVQHL